MNLRACLVIAAFVAAPVYADDIYRSVMPNGDVMYGESPYPGAKSTSKVRRPPSGVVVVTPGDKAMAGQIPTPRGGVSVIPSKDRVSPQGGASAGTSYGSSSLPKRD